MTATGPQHQPPGAPPDPGTQRPQPATGEPQDRNGTRPAFAVELWTSPQLRVQNQGRALSLFEALGRQPASKDREPDQEPEIEP